MGGEEGGPSALARRRSSCVMWGPGGSWPGAGPSPWVRRGRWQVLGPSGERSWPLWGPARVGRPLGGGWRVGTGTVLVWVTAGAFRVAGVLNRRGIGLVGLERLVVVLVVRGWCVRAGCGCGLVWVWGCRLGWFGQCGCFGERIFRRRRCRVGSHNIRGGLGRVWGAIRLRCGSASTAQRHIGVVCHSGWRAFREVLGVFGGRPGQPFALGDGAGGRLVGLEQVHGDSGDRRVDAAFGFQVSFSPRLQETACMKRLA